MANFLNLIEEKGNVYEGDVLEIPFVYEGELSIKKVESSCGCTTPSFDPDNKRVIAKYVAPGLGFHPQTGKKIDSQSTWKSITIEEQNLAVHVLKFHTTIIPKQKRPS